MLELLENAIRATFEQGEKSQDSNQRCLYKTDSGLKCLVGHMLLEDEYKPEFESQVLHRIIPKTSLAHHFPTATSMRVLRTLQNCHDGADNSNFREDFVRILRAEYSRNRLPKDLNSVITELEKKLCCQ